MIIREAAIDDIDKIHKLGKNVDEFDTTDEVVTFWPKHILRNCIQSEKDWLIVAEEEGEIVGFVIVNNSIVFKKAVIENIFISPGHRKKGIGQKILNEALKKIQESGCEYVCTLSEDNDKDAIDFYIKNGFNRGKNFAWMDKVLSKEFSKVYKFI